MPELVWSRNCVSPRRNTHLSKKTPNSDVWISEFLWSLNCVFALAKRWFFEKKQYFTTSLSGPPGCFCHRGAFQGDPGRNATCQWNWLSPWARRVLKIRAAQWRSFYVKKTRCFLLLVKEASYWVKQNLLLYFYCSNVRSFLLFRWLITYDCRFKRPHFCWSKLQSCLADIPHGCCFNWL